jgi:hypothetical protein
MTNPRKLLASAVLVSAVVLGATGCSKPDPNPAVIVTGNPAAANPPVAPTTTSTTTITSTTYFYAQK